MLPIKHASTLMSVNRTAFSPCLFVVPVSRREAARRYHTSNKATRSASSCKPLRILFCGSDLFSSASLRALYLEQQVDPKGIQSIDVLCRPGKRVGRSLKTIRQAPIREVAESLGLTVHERDTFTGWNLPKPDGEPINLIVAVSFGLFVPPRILKRAEYGGLNVHPSLLPNFRGASPLQYTIMHGAEYTGVTLQTLDHESFDHGTILAQTPAPGTKLDLQKKPTFLDILEHVTPLGAEMLVNGIRSRIFVPPLPDFAVPALDGALIDAPKIKSRDKEIDWMNWDATTIGRRYRALGPLWTIIIPDDGKKIRIKLDGIEEIEMPKAFKQLIDSPTRPAVNGKEANLIRLLVTESHDGKRRSLTCIKNDKSILICVKDQAVRVSQITIEGMGKKSARLALDALQKL